VYSCLALEQLAEMLGEKDVISHEGAGAAEEPDSQKHQQILKWLHRITPFFSLP
jgi:hypothetical protein